MCIRKPEACQRHMSKNGERNQALASGRCSQVNTVLCAVMPAVVRIRWQLRQEAKQKVRGHTESQTEEGILNPTWPGLGPSHSQGCNLCRPIR